MCDEWKNAKKKIKKFRKITKAAKAGSSSAVQSALKALGFLPWGVGKILKAIAQALKSCTLKQRVRKQRLVT